MLEFVNADAKNADLRIALGRFYETTGKPDKAKEAYQRIVDDEGLKTNGADCTRPAGSHRAGEERQGRR